MDLPQSLLLVSDLLQKVKPDDVSNVLQDLLTPDEIIDVALRIQIFSLLRQGFSQRHIAQELGISITTVTRGSRVWQYDKKAIDRYIV